MCSIQYQPCFDNSFKIGPNRMGPGIRPPIRVPPVRPGSIVSAANQLFQSGQNNNPVIPLPPGIFLNYF